jgi:tRNA(fMet)-specific endonuclease VapC
MACLDTSIVIDFLKNNSDAISFIENLEDSKEDISIASPTIIELIRGLSSKNIREGEKEKIKELIDSFFVLNLDKQSSILAGEIESELIKTGRLIDLEDIMIAAIAIINSEKLITRNEKHFSRIKRLEIESY